MELVPGSRRDAEQALARDYIEEVCGSRRAVEVFLMLGRWDESIRGAMVACRQALAEETRAQRVTAADWTARDNVAGFVARARRLQWGADVEAYRALREEGDYAGFEVACGIFRRQIDHNQIKAQRRWLTQSMEAPAPEASSPGPEASSQVPAGWSAVPVISLAAQRR